MKMRTLFFPKLPGEHLVRRTLLLLMLVSACTAHAQVVNLSDSLEQAWKAKPGLHLKLDSRHSMITGKSARTMGVKAGITWDGTITMGLGYTWLASKHYEIVPAKPLNPARIRLRYFSPYLEYRFYRKGNWEARIPVQLGIGRSFLETTEEDGRHHYAQGHIVLYEPSMVVEYKVLGILGFGGGLGYRIMMMNNREINQRFTSPVYMFWVRIIPTGFRRLLENGELEQ